MQTIYKAVCATCNKVEYSEYDCLPLEWRELDLSINISLGYANASCKYNRLHTNVTVCSGPCEEMWVQRYYGNKI